MIRLYAFTSIPLVIYFLLSFIYFLVMSAFQKRLNLYLEEKDSFRKTTKVTILLGLFVCLAGIFLTEISIRTRKENMEKSSDDLVHSIGLGFYSHFTNYDNSAKLLSDSEKVREAASGMGDAALPEDLTNELERFRIVYNISVIYIMDTDGTVFISTNRYDKDSFMGRNYSFRPYFQQAVQGNYSNYVALGSTSGQRGYYTAAPVLNDGGEIVAVIAIKKDLEDLENIFAGYTNLFLVSEKGIVFFSSDRDDLYTKLPNFPVADPLLLEQQFGMTAPPETLFTNKASDTVKHRGKYYLFSRLHLLDKNWQLIYLVDLAPLYEVAFLFIAMSSFAVLAIFAAAMMVNLLRTHRSITKAALNERWFRSMYEVAPEAILVVDRENGKISAANEEGQRLFGLSESELKEKRISDLVRKYRIPFSRLVTGEGQPRIARVSQTDILFQEVESSLYYIRDVTDEIDRISELQNSEERYRLLAETLPETVFQVNEKHEIEYLNQTGKEIFGADALNRRTLDSLIAGDQRENLFAYISSVKPNVRNAWQEYSFVTAEGKIFSGVLIVIPSQAAEQRIHYRGLIIDITERKKADSKLHRDEKLESMGLLAGGLAHDFNNLLTVIKAGLSLLEFDNINEDLEGTLIQMHTAVNRGTAITKQLLTFSPGGEPVKKGVDCYLIIQEMLTVVFSGTAIKITLSIPDDLPPLHGDPDQLSEVFQNLMLNARQAMNNRGNFSLTINTAHLDSDNKYKLKGGGYLEFHFIDSGRGIPPDKLARIFDPFFTTKSSGSGLGLSVTYSIIRKHLGFISVWSEQDVKTDFTVFLPVSSQEFPADESEEPELKTGRGRILLMDDDYVIRMVGKKLLERLGYSVTPANNGEETVALYKNAMKNEKFKLVILDLTVPGGMGGKETIGHLREIDPEVKAIVSSGYSVDPVLSSYAKYGFCGMAEKPYDLRELSVIVYNVIHD